jgi:hypothetical protein
MPLRYRAALGSTSKMRLRPGLPQSIQYEGQPAFTTIYRIFRPPGKLVFRVVPSETPRKTHFPSENFAAAEFTPEGCSGFPKAPATLPAHPSQQLARHGPSRPPRAPVGRGQPNSVCTVGRSSWRFCRGTGAEVVQHLGSQPVAVAVAPAPNRQLGHSAPFLYARQLHWGRHSIMAG